LVWDSHAQWRVESTAYMQWVMSTCQLRFH